MDRATVVALRFPAGAPGVGLGRVMVAVRRVVLRQEWTEPRLWRCAFQPAHRAWVWDV